jgi:hypothetical protein
MGVHEAPEELAVIANAQVEQLVDDHGLAKTPIPAQQVAAERHASGRGAGSPLLGHAPDLDDLWADTQAFRPARDVPP